MMIEVEAILATNNDIEYSISVIEHPIPESILEYLEESPDAVNNGKWMLQRSIVNTSSIEMMYEYCPGVTNVDFISGSSTRLYIDYDKLSKMVL